ncbi:MAG: BlaI/MecI/CopY family transcriptional regulator [Pirellulales bacterium]|nr:BlaI/MecI/CopY family transcriptional regulator [Planctomycetales bacterium]
MADQLPTERELELLKVLWGRGEATVRDVCAEMNEAGASLAYTTVLTLLQIMEEKGLVTHRQVGRAYVYAATRERDRTFRQLARGFLGRVFDGSLEEYVRGVLDAQPISVAQLDRLAEMVDAKRREAQRQDTEPPQHPRGG